MLSFYSVIFFEVGQAFAPAVTRLRFLKFLRGVKIKTARINGVYTALISLRGMGGIFASLRPEHFISFVGDKF